MTPKDQLHAAPTNPISARHRAWGAPCMATDIDAILLVEYSHGRIAAIVDYKLGLERKLEDGEGHALATIAELAERGDIPGFVVKYNTDPWRFRVYPMPGYALGLYPHGRGEIITEREWVTFLYQLRGIDALPIDVARVLDDTL